MRQGEFSYKVSVQVHFTADELRMVKECADMHYDATCRNFFKSGKKGNGLRNSFALGGPENDDWIDPFDEACPAELECEPHTYCEFRELDLIAKILEMGHHLQPVSKGAKAVMLGGAVRRMLMSINAENTRVHDEQKARTAAKADEGTPDMREVGITNPTY